MGYPGDYDREDVKNSIAKVLKVCKENNVPSGFHVIESNPSKLNERIEELENMGIFKFLSKNKKK
jgi:2-dehydro-3-deoxyglucarate aldolase